MADAGVFIISLDLELYWGVRDKRTLEGYGENIRGVRRATEAMLAAFAEFDVHATWAAVGFLFFRDADDLRRHLPEVLPGYTNPALSPYAYMAGGEALDRTFHFAPEVIELIRARPGQEVATHTFSHYYCMEDGQTAEAFRADVAAAVAAAAERGVALTSLVFPRNQLNDAYLPILAEFGISCYRGNERNRLYASSDEAGQTLLRRGARVVDAYVNLTGHHTFSLAECGQRRPYSIPSSRFLRPYSRRFSVLERLRLRRIKRAMSDAASQGKVFHLWWHPHNFGVDTARNIAFLRGILEHFADLRDRFGMRSLNMGELARLIDAADPAQAADGMTDFVLRPSVPAPAVH